MVASFMLDHHPQHQNQCLAHQDKDNTDQDDQQQQQQQSLYYAQLLAVQQQAIAAGGVMIGAEAIGGDGKGAEADGGNAREERERREREGSERLTNLIINYLPQSMSQEEVRALFSSMGEVESCKLIRDKATGQSLGYAFVNYEQPEDARKALSAMNGLRLQNKVLKVSLARPSKEDIKGANLYVSGLPKSLTQSELEAAFRPFGNIITSRILSDNVTGLSKGVGFVRFDRKSEAETAIEKMGGTSPWGGDETITVKFANSPSANSSKSAAIQVAQAMVPLQMLQSVPSSATAFSALPVGTPLLHGLSAVSSAQQSTAAGGPIHAHTPQHRFRYSPLAGAPLISGSASSAMVLPSAITSPSVATVPAAALSSLNPLIHSLAQQQPTGPIASNSLVQLGQDFYTAAALQQQQMLLQQQIAAYNQSLIAAANPADALSVAAAAQQQQQYAAYAAAMAAAAAAATNSSAVVPQQQCVSAAVQPQQQNGAISSGSPVGTGPSAAGWTLAVHNLGSDVGEPALWRMFGPFGAVLSVKVAKGKGQATVTMANYEEAAAAVNSLNGTQLNGRTLQIGLKSLSALIR